MLNSAAYIVVEVLRECVLTTQTLEEWLY